MPLVFFKGGPLLKFEKIRFSPMILRRNSCNLVSTKDNYTIIFEDDMEVSMYWYFYSKKIIQTYFYGDMGNEIIGFSLNRVYGFHIDTNYDPFATLLVGTLYGQKWISTFFEIQKGPPFEKKLRQRVPPMVLKSEI